MKYQVKVTVIDKKLYPELQAQYCADHPPAHVRATMWATNLSFAVTAKGMISGTWVLIH